MKKIIVIASILTIIDQLIKHLFSTYMTLGETFVLIPKFFSFTLVKNTGVAFSLFAGNQIPLILLSVIVLFFCLQWISKQKLNQWNILSFSLLIGGIIGNLIDRIFRGGVIDYLDFYLFRYDAPIFNFADICVVVGVGILIILLWKEEKTCNDTK